MKEIDNSENIILGSGDLYIVEFNDTVPEDATMKALRWAKQAPTWRTPSWPRTRP